MYRMYVDEVGTDSVTNLSKDRHRFLSLSGTVISFEHVSSHLEPSLNWIKNNVIRHDPDEPSVFHRTDILGRKGIFQCLNEASKCDLFDRSIIRLVESTEFTLITAMVDKLGLIKNATWLNKHPYHLAMELLVEKFAQFLERHSGLGDIMPERRGSPKDDRLQEAFEIVKRDGTFYVSPSRIASRIRSSKLKFRWKWENVAGLQLCDLIAHPSHMLIRTRMHHDVRLGSFSTRLSDILVRSKYDRSATGKIQGYGIKYIP